MGRLGGGDELAWDGMADGCTNTFYKQDNFCR